jgi:hypothetical protein
MITSEIIPKANKGRQASIALQKAGFKVLSVSFSITIGGEAELFEKVFRTKLIKIVKDVLPSIPGGAEEEYYKPEKVPVIPDEFKDLVEEILFPEPPEYYCTPK